MAKEYSPNPHDRFAAGLLRMPWLMQRLLRLTLPREVLAVLRLKQLRLCSEMLIDQQLRKMQADALYRIPLRGGWQIYLYVLFEHKSWQDPMTALQLLTYITALMQHLRRQGQPLAVVIPIVIYHGSKPWSTPVTLRQLVKSPEALRVFLPEHQVLVLDLPRGRTTVCGAGGVHGAAAGADCRAVAGTAATAIAADFHDDRSGAPGKILA